MVHAQRIVAARIIFIVRAVLEIDKGSGILPCQLTPELGDHIRRNVDLIVPRYYYPPRTVPSRKDCMSEAIGCKYNTKNKGLVSIVGGVYDTRKKASASEQPNSQKKAIYIAKMPSKSGYIRAILLGTVRTLDT